MGEITLYKGIPFDTEYNYTLLKETKSDRDSELNKWEHKKIENVQFTREDTSIKINMKIAEAKKYNYCITNCDDVKIYNFINKWEYISPNVSKCYITTDIIQSYFYDINIENAFVIREHATNDTIGNNIQEENTTIIDYVIGKDYGNLCGNETYICVSSNIDLEGNIKTGYLSSGIYRGTIDYAFEESEVEKINSFINDLTEKGKESAILGIYQRPKLTGYTEHKISKIDNIDGYTPKNNKLYTYPYNFLYVNNMQGGTAIYKYEYFEDINNIMFDITIANTISGQGQLTPHNYKGIEQNSDEAVTMMATIQCQFNIDSFKSWLGNSRFDIIAGLTSSVEGTITGIATQATSIVTGVGGISQGNSNSFTQFERNTILQGIKAYNTPPQTKGNTNGDVNIVKDEFGFHVYQKCINRKQAEIIDKYFTIYGYATNEFKKPKLFTRKEFNFIQTKSIIINGEIENDTREILTRIFNNGLMIFHNKENYGNYEIENEII